MNRIVCQCLLVTEREIKAAIAGGARTVAEVSGACEAGEGCRSCHEAIKLLIGEAALRDRRVLTRQVSLFSDE